MPGRIYNSSRDWDRDQVVHKCPQLQAKLITNDAKGTAPAVTYKVNFHAIEYFSREVAQRD